jgi:flagellar biosynthesis/type III secretory pathway protein FliH
MSFLLWQRDAAGAIGSRRLVYRAAEVPLLADAQRLCERLNEEQAAAAGRIEAAAAAARDAGHAQGCAEGRAAGQASVAATLTSLAEQLARERMRLREDVAALALGVVRKLLGRLDPEDVLAGLAAAAAREMLPGASVTLIVHPSRADGVRKALEQSAPELACEVVGDPDVSVDTCRLETEHGAADASLATQLERIESLWGVMKRDAFPDSSAAPSPQRS